jgi:hypothetical protein
MSKLEDKLSVAANRREEVIEKVKITAATSAQPKSSPKKPVQEVDQ